MNNRINILLLGLYKNKIFSQMANNERSTFQIAKRLLLCTLILLGFYTIFNKNDENKCEMTYMFQYPQYLKVINVFLLSINFYEEVFSFLSYVFVFFCV